MDCLKMAVHFFLTLPMYIYIIFRNFAYLKYI